MLFLNCTPHEIVLNDGTRFAPSGHVARITVTYGKRDELGIYPVYYGEVRDLPAPKLGTMYIVSNMVLEQARAQGRRDVVAPATGHLDTVRDHKGHIVSVPGWQ